MHTSVIVSFIVLIYDTYLFIKNVRNMLEILIIKKERVNKLDKYQMFKLINKSLLFDMKFISVSHIITALLCPIAIVLSYRFLTLHQPHSYRILWEHIM